MLYDQALAHELLESKTIVEFEISALYNINEWCPIFLPHKLAGSARSIHGLDLVHRTRMADDQTDYRREEVGMRPDLDTAVKRWLWGWGRWGQNSPDLDMWGTGSSWP